MDEAKLTMLQENPTRKQDKENLETKPREELRASAYTFQVQTLALSLFLVPGM
jgi:hypothetical protein